MLAASWEDDPMHIFIDKFKSGLCCRNAKRKLIICQTKQSRKERLLLIFFPFFFIWFEHGTINIWRVKVFCVYRAVQSTLLMTFRLNMEHVSMATKKWLANVLMQVSMLAMSKDLCRP